MTKRCPICGSEMPNTPTANKCLKCCRKELQQLFKKYPEFEQTFKETIEELKKPENIKKMSEDTVKFMKAINSVKRSE